MQELEVAYSTEVAQECNRMEGLEALVIPEISAYARKMAEEGIVLLKNEKQTLPINNTDTVAVFGRCAIDYFSMGYGSGGDVVVPYKRNLMDGLYQNEVKVYEKLADKYTSWCKDYSVQTEDTWGRWPLSYPEMPVEESLVMEAASSSDIALVVIGRSAGEDLDNKLEKGGFFLTDEEMNLLDMVTKHFERVAVIMNCGNVIDMSWTKYYGDCIGAILYTWQGGMESGYALADVLTGKQSPSGALMSAIAREYSDYPSSENFGDAEVNNYIEDIYVGYRYFETFAPEKVLYPFGFGLSYTSFEMNTTAMVQDNIIFLQVQVTNVGTCSGKQIVQCYLGLPCGKLGNPKKVLAAFAKTKNLAPKESQVVNLTVDLREFASYDDSGVAGNRSCYVLEAGIYSIEIGRNVRDTECVLRIEKEALEVVRRLREAAAIKAGCEFERMVNQEGKLRYEKTPVSQKDLRTQILEELPKPLEKPLCEIPFSKVLDGTNTVEEFVAQFTLEELDQITHGQGQMNSCYGTDGNAGAFGGVTEDLRKRGLPAIVTTDGPSGIRIKRTVCLLPCATALACSFNTEGVEHLYKMVSKEMSYYHTHMLLGPGMNIHRNPLCGRNFEYYSEDPYLTGKMAAAAIRGIQSEGHSACPKHFACNSQEYYRTRTDSRVSERALREIYLKGFEIAVRDAKPMALMTSYNKVNGVWSHYHYEMVTQILRQEWGYEGLVITDWWMQPGGSLEFPQIRNDAYRIRAQVDVLMPGEFGSQDDSTALTLVPSLKTPDGVTLAEAQRCAKNVVEFIVNYNVIKKTKQ